MGAEPLLIGDRWGRNARMASRRMRVSSVERAAEELAAGRSRSTRSTRILDRFDETFEADGATQTSPEVIFAGESGLPTKPCSFVEGRFGGALALYPGGGE